MTRTALSPGGRRGLAPLAVGPGGQGAGPGDAPELLDGAGPAQALRRNPAGAAARVGTALESGGARGDFPGLAAGDALRTIAARLSRAPSTVSREVAGVGGRHRYRALAADRAAWVRACRPKQTKLARWPGLRAMVEDKLELRRYARLALELRAAECARSR
jgi:hypothetical protein